MKLRRLFTMILVVVMLVPGVVSADATTMKVANQGHRYSDTGLLVMFDKQVGNKDIEAVEKAYGLSRVKTYDMGVALMTIGNGADPAVVASALSKNPHVAYAHPDYIIERPIIQRDLLDVSDTQLAEVVADASEVTAQWGLSAMYVEQAWAFADGDNVVVAVIDTGIQINHEDLVGNIWMNDDIAGDNIDNDGNGYIDDVNGWNVLNDNGDVFEEGKYETLYYEDGTVYGSFHIEEHGTHVAGTIAALGNNGLGTVGVAPKAKIMPIKFFGSSSKSGYTSEAIEAIEYAEINHADVINASWGGIYYEQALMDAIASFSGIFVTAAGNDALDNDVTPNYPASYNLDNIIAVASIDSDLTLSYYSNYGVGSVDIAAPGRAIYSCYPWEELSRQVTRRYPEIYTGGNYISISGTSMASPHVAGVVALMLSTGNYGDDSRNEVIADLLSSVTPDALLSNQIVSGGRVNAEAAVTNDGNGVIDSYTLTLNTSGSGSVVLNPLPLDGKYLQGTSVELTAVADEGYVFDFWSEDVSGTEAVTSIVMDGDKEVTATFIKAESPVFYKLTTEIEGAGSIVIRPWVADYIYPAYTEVTLTAIPGEVSEFVSWEGDVTGSESSITTTMDRAKVVKAIFMDVAPPDDTLHLTITTDSDVYGLRQVIRGTVHVIRGGSPVPGETVAVTMTHEGGDLILNQTNATDDSGEVDFSIRVNRRTSIGIYVIKAVVQGSDPLVQSEKNIRVEF